MSSPAPNGKKKKKKKTRKKPTLKLNMGDTVRLSKGRIGLVRFIGKTQFGLGEWIGIELYNELIKTRHNGAVLGKRYFRCPASHGIFIRRQLIKENIAVKQINPSIQKLRKKEKQMKDARKKLPKKQKKTKAVTVSAKDKKENISKTDNLSKKERKHLKQREKYSHLSEQEFKLKMDGKKKGKSKVKIRSPKPVTTDEKKSEMIKSDTKNDTDIDGEYDWSAAQKKTELKMLKSELTSFSANIAQKIEMKKTEKKLRDLWVIGSKLEVYSYSNENWYSADIIDIHFDDGKEWLQVTYLESKCKEVERYDDDIRRVTVIKSKINVCDDTDGVLESDDSLNDSEAEEMFQQELANDFEENFERQMEVIDEYEHQIDHFEVARKNLAKKLMEQKRLQKEHRRVSHEQKSNEMEKQRRIQKKPSKRSMRSAVSRRASTFIDDQNLTDTLFFDGTEVEDDTDTDQFYVDTMDSEESDSFEDENDSDSEEMDPIDLKIRQAWVVGSKVEIYSHSNEDWFLGEIIEIKIGNEAENDGKEWLEVMYLDSKFKEIQRLSEDIRPILTVKRQKTKARIVLDYHDLENDLLSDELNESEQESEELRESEPERDAIDEKIRNLWVIGSKVEIYSHSNEEWFLGEIIEIKIGNEAENDGKEWLEVMFLDSKFKEIQRHSEDIRPILTDQKRDRTKSRVVLDCDDLEQDSLSESEEDRQSEIKIFELRTDTRNTKIITFFVEFSVFLACVPCENESGLVIHKIHKNEFGKAFYVETGIEKGWFIASIDGNNVSEMSANDIKPVMDRVNSESYASNGYTVAFQRREEKAGQKHGNNLKPSVYVRSKKNLQ